jgi:excisionase family DNA binding protein
MTAPLFLTLKQAAAVTGVSADTLSKAIHAGRLRAKKTASTGGKTLVRLSDLDEWFEGLIDA